MFDGSSPQDGGFVVFTRLWRFVAVPEESTVVVVSIVSLENK